jgi:catechol 2,3-dioxygenase-like lactoylglutathione lyase family enzyme
VRGGVEKSPFLGLRTVIYPVEDLQAAKEWYRQAFGIESGGLRSRAGAHARPSALLQLLGEHAQFAVSFLKALYGDAATPENDWAFHYLPKVDRNYSWTHLWDDIALPSLLGQAASRSPEAAGGRGQTLTDLIALRDGMGIPADRLPLLRGRERRQSPRLYR